MRGVSPLVLEVDFPISIPGIEVDADAGGVFVAPVKAAMVDAGR